MKFPNREENSFVTTFKQSHLYILFKLRKIADPSAGGVINKNVVKPSRMQNGSNEWCKWNFGMNENEIDLEACWLARTNRDAFDVDRKLISCDISARCKSRKFLLCAANPV